MARSGPLRTGPAGADRAVPLAKSRALRLAAELQGKTFAERRLVMAADIRVAHRSHRLAQGFFQAGTPFRRAEIEPIGGTEPEHVEERLRRVEKLSERFRSLAADQVIRVEPAGKEREAEALARLQERQGHLHRAERRLQSRLVAVEAERRLVSHLPEEPKLILGQCRAQRRDRRFKAGGDTGDDVDIAFDCDDAAALAHRRPGRRAVVENVALVKERCLRRVQILGLDIGRQCASAESNDASAEIADRKHDAVAEAIVGDRNVIARDE